MSYDVRRLWMDQLVRCDTLAHTIEHGLEKWASAPSELSQAEREAWLAGFAANAVVQQTLTKMAVQQELPPDEQQFLETLHAEASLRDLQRLTKTALAPAAWGALGGAVLGAGLGAWKDDDNRLRGAAVGALPGAVIGSVAGHGWGSWQQRKRELADAALKQTRIEGEQATLRGLQKTIAEERLSGQRETARKAEEALKHKNEADAAKRVLDQQAAERWHRSATESASDLLGEYGQLAQTDPNYIPLAEQANTLLEHLTQNRDAIVQARMARPGDPVLMAAAIPGYHGQVVQEIQNRAARLYKSMA